MGATLAYRTAAPVPAQAAETIRAEVPSANDGVRWTVLEPIRIDEDEGGYLKGSSKLNPHPWPGEYSGAMAGDAEESDTARLIRRLIGWSDRFGLTWEILVDGSPLGRIVNGVDVDAVGAALESVAALADDLAGFDPITGRAAAGDAPAASLDDLFDDPADEDEPPPEGFQPRLYDPDGR